MKNFTYLFKQLIHFFTKYFKNYYIENVGEPIVIGYENKSASVKKCIIFGGYNFMDAPNFGSDPEIIVIDLINNSYKDILEKSIKEPFKISTLRFYLDRFELHKEKLLKLVCYDCNKKVENSTVILSHLDMYQFQSNILDIETFKNSTIDGSSHFEYLLEGNSKIQFSIYPTILTEVGYFEFREIQRQKQVQVQITKRIIVEFDLIRFFKQLFRIK